jgi:hypothetical protein
MVTVSAGATPSAMVTNGLDHAGTEPDDAEDPRTRLGALRPTISAASIKSVIHRPRAGNAKKRAAVVANAKPLVIFRSVHDEATLSRFLQPIDWPDQGRLPTAASSDDTDYRGLRDCQAGSVECGDLRYAFATSIDLADRIERDDADGMISAQVAMFAAHGAFLLAGVF